MLGNIEGKRRRGWQRMRWLDSITDSMSMNLSRLQKIVRTEALWGGRVEHSQHLNDNKNKNLYNPSLSVLPVIYLSSIQSVYLYYLSIYLLGFLGGSGSKESARNEGKLGSIPRLGRSSGEGNSRRIPTLVFLPGEFHGQKSLLGYSPWDHLLVLFSGEL